MNVYSTEKPTHLAICKVIDHYYNSGIRHFFFRNTLEYRFSNARDTIVELRANKFSSFTFFRNELEPLKNSLVLQNTLRTCAQLPFVKFGSFEEYMDVVKGESVMEAEGEKCTKSWGVVCRITALSTISHSEILVLIRAQKFEVQEFRGKAIYSYPNPSEDYFFIIVHYEGNGKYDANEIYIEKFQGL